jgi:hypothetical protein
VFEHGLEPGRQRDRLFRKWGAPPMVSVTAIQYSSIPLEVWVVSRNIRSAVGGAPIRFAVGSAHCISLSIKLRHSRPHHLRGFRVREGLVFVRHGSFWSRFIGLKPTPSSPSLFLHDELV